MHKLACHICIEFLALLPKALNCSLQHLIIQYELENCFSGSKTGKS